MSLFRAKQYATIMVTMENPDEAFAISTEGL